VPVQLLNPEGLPQPEHYVQVAVATGSRTVYLSDLAAQVEQAYSNVATALAAVGGTFDDVAKLTVFVVDCSPDKLAGLGEGVARVAERLGVDPRKPITLLGVAALGEPDLLVEVEAVAVLA
jgi:enamine deaminase RidA (YjgF/YER057c/UK114 family)